MSRFALIFVILATAAAALSAHPAQSIDLSYDQATHRLDVSFAHKVGDPTTHYIGNIKVTINGEPAVTQIDHSQATADGGQLLYLLVDAKPGDVITVELECNKSGIRKQSLTVE